MTNDQERTGSGGKKSLPDGPELAKISMDALKANLAISPRTSIFTRTTLIASISSQIVPKNCADGGASCERKSVLLAVEEPFTFFDVSDLHLQSRQSRSHRFEIPNREDTRVLEFSVSIIFQEVSRRRDIN